MKEYERLNNNLKLLELHNETHKPIFHLTNGQTHEVDLIRDIISDCRGLLNKIENGTLIELPCKVGDTVYSNERIMFEPVVVKVITTHQSMNLPVSYTVFATAKDGYGIYLSSDNFNEDWVLTKTEAEKKLKELQGE